MELAIALRLAALNQHFYEEHAEDFADTRPRLPAGVARVLARIPRGAQVLEVGCGDGKVGRALARAGLPYPAPHARPTTGSAGRGHSWGAGGYVGLDVSEAMLARARRYTAAEADAAGGPSGSPPGPRGGRLTFLHADLMDPAWPSALPDRAFDWVLAFGVFHHLPGAARRGQVFSTLAGRLTPGGTLAMANWQFARSERLQRRQVPWTVLDLRPEEVEPGDTLLPWERKGRTGLRYVHLLDEAEAQQMATAAGLRVRAVFSADGASGDLNEYLVMTRG